MAPNVMLVSSNANYDDKICPKVSIECFTSTKIGMFVAKIGLEIFKKAISSSGKIGL